MFITLLLGNKLFWVTVGCILCELVHYCYEQWYQWHMRWWGELIVECANEAYASVEKDCDESRYYKLGTFMHRFALLWRMRANYAPGPEEQAAAAMVAALLAEDKD
ncbi:MAG TPA: hypothetical protein GX530_10300 [Corynebacteriales bacterium]|nr:hypothetical protein [Mycobacteriales bacterium]